MVLPAIRRVDEYAPAPMRILFVTPSLGTGGAERLTVNSALSMLGRGHAVGVVFGFLDLQAGPLRDAGVELYERVGAVPGLTNLVPWVGHVRRAVRDFRPDVIYAQSVTTALVARLAAPRLPLLATVHGISHTDERVASLLFRAAKVRLTAVSEATAAGLRRYPWASPVEVLSPGVDSDQVRAQSHLVEQPIEAIGSPSLCVVARQQPEKGVDVLLRALPAVARELPDVGLTVVGMGDQLESNVALAAELGIADRVWFVGMVPNAAPYMAAADVVILPSRREGLPVTVLEALALNRPVVATRVGGTPTVIVPGETGWLAEPENEESLAAAIVACCADPAEAARRAAAGRAVVEERFGDRPMHDRIEALLGEI